MLCDGRFSELERYANAACHRSPTESRGLCFQATLALGREAARLGLHERVRFVRWRVRDDVNFLEHWALATEGDRVIDMTAVQVDGDASPLRLQSAYPRNYVRSRQYPLDVVLDAMDGVVAPGPNYSPRQVWALHRRLFRHDAAQAMRARSAARLIDACNALVGSGVTLFTGHLLERSIERLRQLLMRID